MMSPKKESRFRGEPKLHFDEILLHKGEFFIQLCKRNVRAR